MEPKRAQLHSAMCRLAQGDRSAFGPAFSAGWPLVLTFARRMLRDAPEAEDAAQEAIVKAFGQAAAFDTERDALSWMLALTAYECRTASKRRARRRETSEAPELPSPSTPEREVETAQLLAGAREALGELRPEDLQVLEAAWFDGERPNVSPAAFRKRVQRALERLRVAWRLKHGA